VKIEIDREEDGRFIAAVDAPEVGPRGTRTTVYGRTLHEAIDNALAALGVEKEEDVAEASEIQIHRDAMLAAFGPHGQG
jgi:hypothetical protein